MKIAIRKSKKNGPDIVNVLMEGKRCKLNAKIFSHWVVIADINIRLATMHVLHLTVIILRVVFYNVIVYFIGNDTYI